MAALIQTMGGLLKRSLQTTLDSFFMPVTSPIFSMDALPETNKTFESRFFALPAELRCVVYKFIFGGAKLEVVHGNITTRSSRSRIKIKIKQITTDEILERIQDNKAALLQASKFCKKEALPILASCTTVEFDVDSYERVDVFAVIDPEFLEHVSVVQLHPDHLIRANRTLIPRVRNVILTGEDSSHYDIYDVQHILENRHTLLDSYAPGPYSTFIRTMLDWSWKRQQLLHLAQECGWSIKLMLCDYCYAGRYHGEYPARFEFEHDLNTEKLSLSRLIVGPVTNMVSGNLDNEDDCRKLSAHLDDLDII